MNGLKDRINGDVKQAMRDKDREKLSALRMITAAIKQKEVDERTELDDSRVLAVLDKLSKQHRESIQQYDSAGRADLADKERFELDVLQAYLPEQLGDEEIFRLIESAIGQTGAESIRDMGKVMGVLRPQIQGRADMAAVSDRVKSRLSS